ncbi:MAG: UDP-N-acetylmuramoyl-L-alanyl-D-glutamate--2,6-diaminopimelate ligase [Aggregatilineales bacterium]
MGDKLPLTSVRLSDLLAALNEGHGATPVVTRPAVDPEISAPISEDDRQLLPGGVFVARKGSSSDGHDRIGSAVERGAVAVIGERPPKSVLCPVPYAQVANAQNALGPLAAAYYGYPSRHLAVIGVTGTDGKTTTSTLIYSILKATGVRVGLISTVSAIIDGQELETGLHVTTPTAPEIQMLLRRMVDAGLTHCVLETTSHGLAQGRVRGVEYDVAVLTNVTHEHLDFHGSFEAYRDAKAELFRQTRDARRKAILNREKAFVINADDPSADYFAAVSLPPRTFFYTLQSGETRTRQTFQATRIDHTPAQMNIEIRYPARKNAVFNLSTHLTGDYNVQNILAALAATWALLNPGDWRAFNATVQAGLDALPPIPGRMERIDAGQDFLAIVDFAHTPNALDNALRAARTLIAPGKRVIAVFGCAGLRDRDKRRLMAEVSAQLADGSVFTAEDPRTESLDVILATMAEAAEARGGVESKTFWRVRDRGQALAFACSMAQPGDLVIACGKGHEQSMCFGTTEYPWDDREALRGALRGNPPRTLPTATHNE